MTRNGKGFFGSFLGVIHFLAAKCLVTLLKQLLKNNKQVIKKLPPMGG